MPTLGARLRASFLWMVPLLCPVALVTGSPSAKSPVVSFGLPQGVAGIGSSAAAAEQSQSDSQPALSLPILLEQILARNPSLAQMAAAQQAAAARYPQVTSLEDPMFGTSIGPASIGSRLVDFGYRVEVAQKLPFPGKLHLRGQRAQAEASAAAGDVEDMRLLLIESGKSAFYDYYLVGRALVVNQENLDLLKEFRQNAEARYRTGLVPQQDVLQAEVEIGRQTERQLELDQLRRVALARLNTLMHLPPDAPLPPPPQQVVPGKPLPEASQLRAAALAQRPDLKALADRVVADQTAVALAHKEWCPDLEVMAAYDAFWQERDLRPMLGVRLNLPVYQARRHAGVAEAQARLAQRQAELARLMDQINFQVQEAHAQADKSARVVRLYEGTILPAATANVKAAQSAYTTGKVPFLTLIQAQREAVQLRDRYFEATADFHRRLATLERVVGGRVSAEGP